MTIGLNCEAQNSEIFKQKTKDIVGPYKCKVNASSILATYLVQSNYVVKIKGII